MNNALVLDDGGYVATGGDSDTSEPTYDEVQSEDIALNSDARAVYSAAVRDSDGSDRTYDTVSGHLAVPVPEEAPTVRGRAELMLLQFIDKVKLYGEPSDAAIAVFGEKLTEAVEVLKAEASQQTDGVTASSSSVDQNPPKRVKAHANTN